MDQLEILKWAHVGIVEQIGQIVEEEDEAVEMGAFSRAKELKRDEDSLIRKLNMISELLAEEQKKRRT